MDVITVYQDDAGQWRWHRQAANGEIVSQGEAHTTQRDAERAATRANPDLGGQE